MIHLCPCLSRVVSIGLCARQKDMATNSWKYPNYPLPYFFKLEQHASNHIYSRQQPWESSLSGKFRQRFIDWQDSNVSHKKTGGVARGGNRLKGRFIPFTKEYTCAGLATICCTWALGTARCVHSNRNRLRKVFMVPACSYCISGEKCTCNFPSDIPHGRPGKCALYK